MANRVKRGFEKNIFINCPFDDKYYQSLLRPLLFTIVYLKFNPKIALIGAYSGKQRLDKIVDLIRQSKYGVHDLSRLKATKKGEFYRLNMPFELGVDYGTQRFSSNHLKDKKQLILEKSAYDYKKALSDISALEIMSHGNKPVKLVQALRYWFVDTVKVKNVAAAAIIWYKFTDFTSDFHTKRKKEGFSDEDLRMMPVQEYLDYIKSWLRVNR